MARGVPPGANNPYQVIAEYPGTADSVTVGMSGASTARLVPVTASTRMRSDETSGSSEVMLEIMNCTSPLSSAGMAGADPRNGTRVISSPAIALSNVAASSAGLDGVP